MVAGLLFTSTAFNHIGGRDTCIVAAKTGYTDQALNTLATYAKIDGKGIAIYLYGDNMFYIYDTDFVEGDKRRLAVIFTKLGIKVK